MIINIFDNFPIFNTGGETRKDNSLSDEKISARHAIIYENIDGNNISTRIFMFSYSHVWVGKSLVGLLSNVGTRSMLRLQGNNNNNDQSNKSCLLLCGRMLILVI